MVEVELSTDISFVGMITDSNSEEYGIAVKKGNTELLNAINEVLDTLLVKDENGVTEIEKLVMKHMGLE